MLPIVAAVAAVAAAGIWSGLNGFNVIKYCFGCGYELHRAAAASAILAGNFPHEKEKKR